jgi:hypothetical protein
MVYVSGSQPGVRIPLGICEKLTGVTQNSKNTHLGRILDLGVRHMPGVTILIWGFPEGYNFDLGVCKYQNFEKPCSMSYPLTTSTTLVFMCHSFFARL